MRPSPEMIPILIDAAKALKSSQRRLSMARTVSAMGRGGQIWAEVHRGPALPAPSHGLDRPGHEVPPPAPLEGLGDIDEVGDHLGFGAHLRSS